MDAKMFVRIRAGRANATRHTLSEEQSDGQCYLEPVNAT